MGKPNKLLKLSESDKANFLMIYRDKRKSFKERQKILRETYDITDRTITRWVEKLGGGQKKHSEEYEKASKRKLKSKAAYLFTWAQNATPIHQKMLSNMEAYAEFLNADIHVIAGRYKNPTSVFTEKQEREEWWDGNVLKYLDANRHKIHPELTILADLKIHPTAIYPLSGLEGMSKGGSIIVGSPKIHLQPFPVLKGDNPKFALSTGAITYPNYTDSKSGKRGEFFHMLGFTIVEIDEEGEFYFRQVQIDEEDGSFIDLDLEVREGKINEINECEAFICGDAHVSEIDEAITYETLNLLDHIKPKYTIFHDIFNGRSISHHDKKDPIRLYEKYTKKQDILEEEVKEILSFLFEWLPFNPVIVSANHNDWLDRWIASDDWRKDIKNSLWYSRLLTVSLEGNAPNGLIAYLIEQEYGDDVICLGRDESFKIKGYELAYHGDQGQNGSKGNLRQFARLNTKVVVGDYHSGARIDGALGVGTMTPLRLNYNKGASSWNNSHVIIHKNGKAQHIIFKSNKKFSSRC